MLIFFKILFLSLEALIRGIRRKSGVGRAFIRSIWRKCGVGGAFIRSICGRGVY